MSTRKSTKSDKSQGGLLAENYLAVTSKAYTRHASFCSDRKSSQSQYLSHSFNCNIHKHSSNEYFNDQEHSKDPIPDTSNTPTQQQPTHDVLSDSECVISNHNPRRPVNVRKILDISRSKSASFRKSSVKFFFKHKHAKYGDNTASPLLTPPHYHDYSKYGHKHKHKHKRTHHKRDRSGDEYKGYEYHISNMGMRMREDSVLESDYTSMYSSGSEDDDAASLYKFQLKRWRQMKGMWFCCKWQCCLDGSYLCQCMNSIHRILRTLIYYKWVVISLVFMFYIALMNMYSFASKQSQDNVNQYITTHIFDHHDHHVLWTFDVYLFCQIMSVSAFILVIINMYLSFLFYKMNGMTVLLLLNEAKYNKQLNRVKDRRDVILLQKQHANELYHFGEKIWNRLLFIHEHFARWNSIVQHNLNQIKNVCKSENGSPNEEAKENDDTSTNEKIQNCVSNLYTIHESMVRYNAEMEYLILKKLKNDIEDNVNRAHLNHKPKKRKRIEDLMLEHQFDNFIKKVPKRYRKMFHELRNEEHSIGERAVPYARIYMALTRLLDTYTNQEEHLFKSASRQSDATPVKGGATVTSDRMSSEPTPISTLFGGYLQYGDDEEIANIFAEASQPRLTSNLVHPNVYYQ
eukprot:252441_1